MSSHCPANNNTTMVPSITQPRNNIYMPQPVIIHNVYVLPNIIMPGFCGYLHVNGNNYPPIIMQTPPVQRQVNTNTSATFANRQIRGDIVACGSPSSRKRWSSDRKDSRAPKANLTFREGTLRGELIDIASNKRLPYKGDISFKNGEHGVKNIKIYKSRARKMLGLLHQYWGFRTPFIGRNLGKSNTWGVARLHSEKFLFRGIMKKSGNGRWVMPHFSRL